MWVMIILMLNGPVTVPGFAQKAECEATALLAKHDRHVRDAFCLKGPN